MRKIVVKEWMTLDGVFDAETMDQWWNPYASAERQKYIKEGYSSCDVYLLGRTTYEMLWPYWSTQTNDDDGPGRMLNSVHKYVVSTTLKEAPWKDILIDGSATLVQSLMETDLIDEYRFLIQPIIMGSGKRFFKEGMPITRLKLVTSKTLSLGVVALTYQPDRKEP